jgi:subtilase family serine protease
MTYVSKILALCLLATASASVLHSEPGYGNGWVKDAAPQPDSRPVSFTIVVREQRLDAIKKIALDVNDPDSPNYGQFLSQEQLDGLVAPAAEDMAAVKGWLDEHHLSYHQVGVSNLVVSTTVAKASAALTTRFHKIFNLKHSQSVVRASNYYLPTNVHNAVSAVFGLHGLPIPPQKPLIAQSILPGKPASVTPDVLETTYNVGGVKVTRSTKNRQAVAEFQGQFMNSTDLKNMFAKYVKDYEKGTDDVVYSHHGEFKESSGGIEAELDIQYIMAPAVGIKTEFWMFPGMDFCNDLNQWTSNLSSTADIPIVHSVSYGWQGNLSQVHCKDSDLKVVDDNFAKLAAKGVSIMISSGDSGSGYSTQNSQCMVPEGGGKAGTAIQGTVKDTTECHGPNECCERAGSAPGWTFTPAPKYDVDLTTDEFNYDFKNAPFHTQMVLDHDQKVFVTRDVQTLDGTVTSSGGKVSVKNLNNTFQPSEVTFSAPYHNGRSTMEYYSNVSATLGGQTFSGKAIFFKFGSAPPRCLNIEWEKEMRMLVAIWEEGPNPPPPPPPGKCTIYSEVTGHVTANQTVISGGSTKPNHVQLWPSWPASSPWVTSVGATRFVDQKVGNPEMATDQFGSGGGFSAMFDQTDAKWQQDAVANYLKTVDQSSLPPSGSFNPQGRATPDVSALGEGYQVVVNDRVEPVGGTSASSPMFASLVSLLNEQRLNSNKPAMGFLNPFLYKNADAFTDVTLGSNKIGRGGQPLPYGFNCSKGWDPATGLGTPKFDKLLSAAMAAVRTEPALIARAGIDTV